jgi:predicted acyl esterase
MPEDELARNRCRFGDDIIAHPLDDDYHRARSPDWDKVTVPFLSAANWGGQGLHPRGNFEGFVRAASKQKWLECHGLEHWTHFYTDYGRELQKRFFDFHLKGKANGWDLQPRVQLQVRHVDGFVERHEAGWPLAATVWTKFYLNPGNHSLSLQPPTEDTEISFAAMGDGLTFMSAPLTEETEITGPLAAGLRVSSSTEDADIFVVFRMFSPDLREVTFAGAIDPHTPVAQGWLRASHRKLDEALSRPYRPYHRHDEVQPLQPESPVDLAIELWPTSVVVPRGYRIALSIRGTDYQWQAKTGLKLSNFKNELLGCGPFLHDDPRDRPPRLFAGTTTLHIDSTGFSHVLVPIIPNRANGSP